MSIEAITPNIYPAVETQKFVGVASARKSNNESNLSVKELERYGFFQDSVLPEGFTQNQQCPADGQWALQGLCSVGGVPDPLYSVAAGGFCYVAEIDPGIYVIDYGNGEIDENDPPSGDPCAEYAVHLSPDGGTPHPHLLTPGAPLPPTPVPQSILDLRNKKEPTSTPNFEDPILDSMKIVSKEYDLLDQWVLLAEHGVTFSDFVNISPKIDENGNINYSDLNLTLLKSGTEYPLGFRIKENNEFKSQWKIFSIGTDFPREVEFLDDETAGRQAVYAEITDQFGNTFVVGFRWNPDENKREVTYYEGSYFGGSDEVLPENNLQMFSPGNPSAVEDIDSSKSVPGGAVCGSLIIPLGFVAGVAGYKGIRQIERRKAKRAKK